MFLSNANPFAPRHLRSLCLIAVAAGITAVPTAATATPARGSLELRLPGAPLNGLGLGPVIAHTVPEKGNNSTVVNIGAGLGYFLTDTVELGATLALVWLDGGGDSDASFGPQVSPFVRAFSLVAPRVALFGEASVTYFRLGRDDSSNSAFGFGLDAGAEFFVADSWALRVAPAYRHWDTEFSGSGIGIEQKSNVFGIGWGIAAYF